MDKTQLEIMGLIEPFMSKELAEGCLVEVGGHLYKVLKYQGMLTVFGYLEHQNDYKALVSPSDLDKILGHYDTTSLTKYITSFKGIMCYVFDKKFGKGDVLQIYKLADIDQEFGYYYIPNKPLSLYTNQENKDLLELLTKLNNGNM